MVVIPRGSKGIINSNDNSKQTSMCSVAGTVPRNGDPMIGFKNLAG
jgi:hypothetical protein